MHAALIKSHACGHPQVNESWHHRLARTCNLVPVTMTARDYVELSFGCFPQGILASTLSSSSGTTSDVQFFSDCSCREG